MNFQEQVLNLTKQIPEGRISTYGEIAEALGDIRAARAVGNALNKNLKLREIPCHRVVMSNGSIGGYSRGVKEKIKLLEKEEINIKNNKILNFKNILFESKEFKIVKKDSETCVDLKKLRKIQKEIEYKIILKDNFSEIKSVAGFDIAYATENNALGACIVFDCKTKKVIEEQTIEAKVDFPYISTYLTFREFPIIEKLFKNLKNKPTISMIDGNGILHPRGVGIASHAGVLLDIPAIGVAKTLLCGEVIGDKVIYKGKLIGNALKSEKAKNPVYVSPGHKISFETAKVVVKNFLKYRIPEPVRQAHLLAVKLKNQEIKQR